MPRFWEIMMSSWFPEIGKYALPACSEGIALSRAHLSQAEGSAVPAGFSRVGGGGAGSRSQEKGGPRNGSEFRELERKAGAKGCTQRQGAASRAA